MHSWDVLLDASYNTQAQTSEPCFYWSHQALTLLCLLVDDTPGMSVQCIWSAVASRHLARQDGDASGRVLGWVVPGTS